MCHEGDSGEATASGRELLADASRIRRVRRRCALVHRRGARRVDDLSDSRRRPLAHATDDDSTATWSIEVADNTLPAVWLFAILVGCRRWGR
jgi:hypothetical protein